jgi:hypothetical protein
MNRKAHEEHKGHERIIHRRRMLRLAVDALHEDLPFSEAPLY